MNQRIVELENNNNILDAELANKEFKEVILNQIEEISNKQSYDIKNLKSKIFF